jgi:hypothetical protein
MNKEYDPFDALLTGEKTEVEIKIEELITPLEQKIETLKEEIKIWKNKVYKENNKVIKFDNTEIVGEIPYREYHEITITKINEKRRINRIEVMQEEIKTLENHIKAIKRQEKYFNREKMEVIDYSNL